MTYYLGIDIGTTFTAAAVWRDGRTDVASLGNRAPSIPTVVLLRDDGSVLVGEAAVRRAATEPDRVAREFKRRVGDPTPIILGGTPYSADALMAHVLRAVVAQVSEVEGGPPAGVAVSHPANWGAYKLDLLRQAITRADLDDVATVTEPEAAAIHYASQSRVEPGSVVAVYDLGGGTFDAAVLRKAGDGWEILGSPEGIERLGGVDFDQAVFHHVATAISPALDELDPDDPAAQAAVARLRQECVDAKEALSSDTDVSIPVLLPGLQTEVRLTRSEYEAMVRPALTDSITAMNRALRSAEVEPQGITAVLLVGGSSRTPLVAELVSSAFGRPVAVDAHPKYAVCTGAAIMAATVGGALDGGAPAAATPAGAGATTEALPPTAAHHEAPAAHAGAGDATVVQPEAPARTAAAPAADPLAPRVERDPRRVVVPGDGGPPPDRRRPRRDSGEHRAPGHPGPGRAGRASGEHERADGGSRRWLGAVAALALLVLAGGIAAVALRGGDDDPDATAVAGGATDGGAGAEAPDPGGAGAPATTAPPESVATTVSELEAEGPFIRITDVEIDDATGQYRAYYEVIGYTPEIGGEGTLHVHLFPDTQPPDRAGTNGIPEADWHVTDEASSALTKYTPESIGADATQMCAAVADHDHAVHRPEVRTGNCHPLPDR
ncbi:MAG: Hsp70 family protein [Acidimicrobiia bacterium]